MDNSKIRKFSKTFESLLNIGQIYWNEICYEAFGIEKNDIPNETILVALDCLKLFPRNFNDSQKDIDGD